MLMIHEHGRTRDDQPDNFRLHGAHTAQPLKGFITSYIFPQRAICRLQPLPVVKIYYYYYFFFLTSH